MNDVVVVGCGNIGSRLIQSLSNMSPDIVGKVRIVGVEPFLDAWPTVESRFAEANEGQHSLMMVDSPEGLPSCAELVVFAMDSRNRLEAMTNTLALCRPKTILLEKILFSKPTDYETAKTLIDECSAKCWVNTSRNVWPGYQALKGKLAGQKIVEFSVSGSDWGLACNAIHFLSAFEFITGDRLEALSIDLGSAVINSSKRAGYKELTGTLNGVSKAGAIVTVSSVAEQGVPITVSVKTESGEYLIHEGKTVKKLGGPDQEDAFRLLYTSQLHNMFEGIIRKAHSDLPTFSESSDLHLQLLKALNEVFFGKASLAYECPIT